MRFRSPFDDEVSLFDVAVLVAFLAIIGGLVAWGVGVL